jgi:hypothetical protein
VDRGKGAHGLEYSLLIVRARGFRVVHILILQSIFDENRPSFNSNPCATRPAFATVHAICLYGCMHAHATRVVDCDWRICMRSLITCTCTLRLLEEVFVRLTKC